MTGDGRGWLAAYPLAAPAREQMTVALAMIDALECQMLPLEKELRAYARRQAGGKAPRVADRSKAARPRAQHTSLLPRARAISQPQFNPDNPANPEPCVRRRIPAQVRSRELV